MKSLRRILLVLAAIVGIILFLFLTGVMIEQFVRRSAERKLPPHGKLYDVGGHSLHCYKKGNGGPTVVFESSLDPAGHLMWLPIQEQLRGDFTTFSYDRAGLLWSERGSNPKSGMAVAEELHALLEAAACPPPYILVGHSLGGIIVRAFADHYPGKVGGMILVDSTHPEEERFMSPELYKLVSQGMPGGLLKFANALGLLRPMFQNYFPEGEAYAYLNTLMPALMYKSGNTVLEEQVQLPAIFSEARKFDPLNDLPLVVISAMDPGRFDDYFSDEGMKEELLDAHEAMQEDLMQLSSANHQVLALSSSHYVQEDEPDLIMASIMDMVSLLTPMEDPQ